MIQFNILNNFTTLKKYIYIFIGGVFLFLVTYRTFVPQSIETFNTIKDKNITSSEVFTLQSLDKDITISITKKGAQINNIFLEKYNYNFLSVNNCFESGYLSDEERNIPNRNTTWEIVESYQNKITLFTKISGRKFIKKIYIIDSKIIIQDYVPPSSHIAFYSYGVFTIQKDTLINFITFIGNKFNQTNNKNIKKNQKQKVSNEAFKKWFGLENDFFLLFCNTENGNVFLQNSDNDINYNQMFFLSNKINQDFHEYTIYCLPKDLDILKKNKINNVIDYGLFSFLIQPLVLIINYLYKKTESVLFILLFLIIVFFLAYLRFFFILEREKFKLFIHKDAINRQNTEEQLMIFYEMNDIKMNKLIFNPLILYFLCFILKKILHLSFFLHQATFLWIKDLSSIDSYSIINLYGLLNFPIRIIPFISYIATDILSIIGIMFFLKIIPKMPNQTQNNVLFQYINIFLLFSGAKMISSSFMLCFIIICCLNTICGKIFFYFLLNEHKKNQSVQVITK
jgi:hypothetical protein